MPEGDEKSIGLTVHDAWLLVLVQNVFMNFSVKREM